MIIQFCTVLLTIQWCTLERLLLHVFLSNFTVDLYFLQRCAGRACGPSAPRGSFPAPQARRQTTLASAPSPGPSLSSSTLLPQLPISLVRCRRVYCCCTVCSRHHTEYSHRFNGRRIACRYRFAPRAPPHCCRWRRRCTVHIPHLHQGWPHARAGRRHVLRGAMGPCVAATRSARLPVRVPGGVRSTHAGRDPHGSPSSTGP